MQLLRMHVGTLLGARAERLTISQRLAYITGGLQWLNDPITVAFTMIMLIAASALTLGESLYLQPLVAGTVLVPPLFVLFGVMRFLWAFRLRAKCSWSEAVDSFVMLLGLTWVVALACIRGLTARRGVFLRTPKQGERPRLSHVVRIVWFESILTTLCAAAMAILILRHPMPLFSARSMFLVMLAWQCLIYLSAARSSVWNYRSYATPVGAERLAWRVPGEVLRVWVPEWRMASTVAALTAGFGFLFWIAVVYAPTLERAFRSDPFNQFLSATTLLPATPESEVAAQLVREADAARRHDVSAALTLWDAEGVVRDDMFTPDTEADDKWWRDSTASDHGIRRNSPPAAIGNSVTRISSCRFAVAMRRRSSTI
jgi:hypothetical protein